MREHLNGRTVIPVQEWQEERNDFLSKKNSLTADYQRLKSDIRNMENIRKFAVMIDDMYSINQNEELLKMEV